VILLDTDVCVEILRGNRGILDKAGTEELLAVSFITAGELYYGAFWSQRRERNLDAVRDFLSKVEVIESDGRIMARFGALKAGLRHKGVPLPDADLLVAATALEQGGSLATGNLRHFRRISGLRLLDWLGRGVSGDTEAAPEPRNR
jgi:predicted nucleic acid-binding protein